MAMRGRMSFNFLNDSIYIEKQRHDLFYPNGMSETGRLYYLCKIWGFVKYYHDYDFNIDDLLLEEIERTKSCLNREEFSRQILDILQKFSVREDTLHRHDIEEFTLISNHWFEDTVYFEPEVTETLQYMWKYRPVRNKKSGTKYREHIYSNNPYPDESRRILSLFRYWNKLNYFYVYKNFIDESWDKVLFQFIPVFIHSGNANEYNRGVLALTSRLKENHSTIYSRTVNREIFNGSNRTNFDIKKIGDTFVVNRVEKWEEEIQAGDIILQINQKDIFSLFDSINQLVSGGNKWINQRIVNEKIVQSTDTAATLLIEREGAVFEKNIKYYTPEQFETRKNPEQEKGIAVRWISDSIAYIDLRHVDEKNIKKVIKEVKKSQALILDIRCYPSAMILFPLTDFILPAKTHFTICTYPDTNNPGMLRWLKSYDAGYSPGKAYKGKVALLVNEYTSSYSEFLTMALQTSPNVITVGNSTAGSDGNITSTDLLGEIRAYYTGYGVYYPDFTPTQRVGVRIDYTVEPTIEDIKNSVDGAYEEAVRILREKT
jgi:C-terminal processing protease CtpA/Prc